MNKLKTVRVYYAGIPPNNKNKEKELVLHNFHCGVSQNNSTEVFDFDYKPSDLAVIQGWVHANSGKAPHLLFRKNIIEKQKNIKKHTLAIDSNLFLYADTANRHRYLRFSLDGVFPTTGNYFTDSVDPQRWQKIKKDIDIDLKPWRKKGKYILICLQRNGGWSMDGKHVMDWCNETIINLKKYTDRPIVVRAHPGDKKVSSYLEINHSNVKISNNPSLANDFHKAWATVTYNSSPGVASAIEGVPLFVTDPEPRKSQAYDVCNVDLSNIENPKMPDRQSWIEKISMSHFNFDDLKSGIAWNIIKEYI